MLEGRNIASVVFPEADIKFYLDASIEERAKRRYRELKDKEKGDISTLKEGIEERDRQNMGRDIGPLRRDKEAIYIDTTSMTLQKVILKINKEIEKKKGDKRK